MIHSIHQAIFYIHVIVGTISLVSFWVPLFTVKGSLRHKQAGKLFARCMYAVSISGIFMTLIALAMPVQAYLLDPGLSAEKLAASIESIRSFNSFLFMLSLLVFCSTHHAISVVKFKNNRAAMRNSYYLTPIILLAVCGIGLIIIGIQKMHILYMVFGGVSISASSGMLKYIFRKQVAANRWLIEHFSGLIGSGIGAYTAFLAFGGRRVLDHIFVGNLQLIPWVAPSIVGIAFTIWLTRKYNNKVTTNKVQDQTINSRNNEVAKVPLGNEKLS